MWSVWVIGGVLLGWVAAGVPLTLLAGRLLARASVRYPVSRPTPLPQAGTGAAWSQTSPGRTPAARTRPGRRGQHRTVVRSAAALAGQRSAAPGGSCAAVPSPTTPATDRTPTRPAPRRRSARRLLTVGAGVLVITTGTVSAAAALGGLPGPAQTAASAVIEAVTPFEVAPQSGTHSTPQAAAPTRAARLAPAPPAPRAGTAPASVPAASGLAPHVPTLLLPPVPTAAAPVAPAPSTASAAPASTQPTSDPTTAAPSPEPTGEPTPDPTSTPSPTEAPPVDASASPTPSATPSVEPTPSPSETVPADAGVPTDTAGDTDAAGDGPTDPASADPTEGPSATG